MHAKSYTWSIFQLVVALLVTAGSCSTNPSQDREYTQVVTHQGNPMLEVQCSYIGKQPADPANFENDHDYHRTNTDFYELTMENLTDREIAIVGVKYRLKKGPFRGNSSASAESIKKQWGTNVIAPRGSLSRGNNMVFAKAASNILFKNYSFRTTDETGQTVSFQTELPFVYFR